LALEEVETRRSPFKLALIGAGVTLGGIVVTLGVLLALRWRTPLAPPLNMATRTSESVPGSSQDESSAVPSATQDDAASPEPSMTPSPTPEPVCGAPPQMTLLAVGTDSRSRSYLYGLGDVIRIVRADFVNEKVTALAFPRDMWVEVPGIEQHGITHGKLNQAYLWGTEGMGFYENPAQGAGLLALTLEHNFGLRVDNYVTVNMRTFSRLVDAVGGIYVYVPTLLDGRYDNVTTGGKPLGELPKKIYYGYFKPGSYLMDGDTALTYARIRAMDGDFQRQKRQYQVLMALRDRMLKPDIIDNIPDIIDAFEGSFLTDLSAEQISQLTCLGLRLKEDDIHLTALSEDMFTPGFSPTGEYILTYDQDQIRGIVADFLAGNWPKGE
jgi:LCP family protein required for cell wall assembly